MSEESAAAIEESVMAIRRCLFAMGLNIRDHSSEIAQLEVATVNLVRSFAKEELTK